MSRIGKKAIKIPDGVQITLSDHKICVTGPKGTIEKPIIPPAKVQIDENNKQIRVECSYQTKQDKAVHGLVRSLVNNMIIGVTKGYQKRLEIIGVGYNAKLQENDLIIQIGFTHPVKISYPKSLSLTTPNPNLIIIEGVDKELVGQFAVTIRTIKPSNPYTLKGIKYADEIIRRKAGKTFVSGK